MEDLQQVEDLQQIEKLEYEIHERQIMLREKKLKFLGSRGWEIQEIGDDFISTKLYTKGDFSTIDDDSAIEHEVLGE